jgi:hypothetical protein
MTRELADIRTPMHPGSLRCSSLAYRDGYAAVVAPRDPGASTFSVCGDFRVRTLVS